MIFPPLTESDDDLRFYSTAQVAELLQVSKETVRDWIATKQLPAIKLDLVYRIRRNDLIVFVNRKYGER